MDFLDSGAMAQAAKYVLDAVELNNWGAALAAGIVFFVVLAVRSGLASRVPFLTTERGGAVLVIAVAGTLGLFNTLMAGEPITRDVVFKSILMSALAAGGRAIAKALLYDNNAAKKGPPQAITAVQAADTMNAKDEAKREHVAIVCSGEWCNASCMWCEGGLFGCSVCASFEGATTTDCPGVRMTQAQIDAVYAGTLDFRAGQWVNAPSGSCSSHSSLGS